MRYAIFAAVLVAFALGCKKKDDDAGSGGSGVPVEQKPTTPADESAGYPDAAVAPKQRIVRGDTIVRLVNAKLHGKSELTIALSVGNRSKDKLLNFKGWGTTGALKDDKGNKYDSLSLGADFAKQMGDSLRKEKGDAAGYGAGPVYEGRPVLEVLAFDRPVPGATSLVLELPGAAIDSKDPLRFSIPQAMWAK